MPDQRGVQMHRHTRKHDYNDDDCLEMGLPRLASKAICRLVLTVLMNIHPRVSAELAVVHCG